LSSATRKGFNVVFEGQRYNLRVFRRYIYPIAYSIGEKEHMIYSDTGRESEIDYDKAKHYDLEDPFKRMTLIRLAKVMNCLDCEPGKGLIRECRVVICTSEEFFDRPTDKVAWVPFNPERLEPFEDIVRRLEENVRWESRK
jgi:hypothetical protein